MMRSHERPDPGVFVASDTCCFLRSADENARAYRVYPFYIT